MHAGCAKHRMASRQLAVGHVLPYSCSRPDRPCTQAVPDQMAGVIHLKSCLDAGRPAILLGAPGSGKTATWQMLRATLAGQGQKVQPCVRCGAQHACRMSAWE